MDQEYIAQTALDQMVGTDQGQLLKALIPYFPPRQQQFLSVFAKARELSNTVALFTKPSEAMQIQAAAAPAPAPVAAPVEAAEADDTELIAVIAAAIAAAEGTTTDGFVVRSIRKINRKKNKSEYGGIVYAKNEST